jgi:hypothetical protein
MNAVNESLQHFFNHAVVLKTGFVAPFFDAPYTFRRVLAVFVIGKLSYQRFCIQVKMTLPVP